jgi:hypothetical protein
MGSIHANVKVAHNIFYKLEDAVFEVADSSTKLRHLNRPTAIKDKNDV